MKNVLVLIGTFAFFLFLNGIFFGWYNYRHKNDFLRSMIPTPTAIPTPKPLLEFTFDNLSQREYIGSKINLERELTEYSGEKHKAYLFSFLADGKKVTGQANFPKGIDTSMPDFSQKNQATQVYDSEESQTQRYDKADMKSLSALSNKKFPVVIMLRGYVDQEIYKIGVGTSKAAGVFADNGYITLAPDFLGYGESDPPIRKATEGQGIPEYDVWWERFFNPVVVLELLASVKNIEQADSTNIYIWAHSNGGQIALSVLEITTLDIPTTLWAPVTKPFPFSILFFTDEFEDEGKALRAEVARLEKDYDVSQFSITNYFKKINAPLQLHQGLADTEVPVMWSDEFVTKMKELEKDVEYFKYEEADHNLSEVWDEVIEKDLEFFKKERK